MLSNNHHFNNVVIVSGPVIIKDNKVLLNKHGESNLWKFPGGDINAAQGDLGNWTIKKAKEEMGITVRIIQPLSPMVIWKDEEVIILIHYLAETNDETIRPADYIKEYGWHDINSLPADLSPNIKPIIEEYKEL